MGFNSGFKGLIRREFLYTLYIPQSDGLPLANRPAMFSILLATHFITRSVCLYNKIYKEKGESCDLYVEDELFIPSF